MILKKFILLRSVFDDFLNKVKYCYFHLNKNSFSFCHYHYHKKFFKKRSFVVKGMGYRIFYKRFETDLYFFLELGFSHFIVYKIGESALFLKVNKMSFDLVSSYYEMLGNLSSLLVKCVSENIYNFKGIFCKSYNFRVKIGKKK